jgi:hypothetical protein
MGTRDYFAGDKTAETPNLLFNPSSADFKNSAVYTYTHNLLQNAVFN